MESEIILLVGTQLFFFDIYTSLKRYREKTNRFPMATK